MDLTTRLTGAAAGRASALVVEVPGWARTRWAVESELRRRGWRSALSPADADLLVTCGHPGSRLAEALDLVWAQLPGPRARGEVPEPSAAAGVLDELAARLGDGARQRRDAADRPAEPERGEAAASAGEHEDMEPGGRPDEDMGDMDMCDMDMGDMDMGDMDMEPDGIPLAGGGGGDRDGLDLDVLHVPLGPVLPCWPAGLVLHCTLHGDVVAEVRPEVLAAAAGSPGARPPYGTPADRLDRAAQVLTLAGWDDAATQAARLRDLLDGGDSASGGPALDRLTRRVARSRTLRWSLHGLGRIGPGVRRDHGLLGPGWDGDVRDRLLGLLAEARAGLAGHRSAASPTPIDLLPQLVTGLDVTALRLVVASLDLDAAQHHARAVTA